MKASNISAAVDSQTWDLSQVPGFWRRIRLYPAPGSIYAGLEDDFHRFVLQMTHQDGAVVHIDTRSERFPWSTCPDAGEFLREHMVGKPLQEVAALDAHNHCTHLFELLVLCAAHASDTQSRQFDLRIADRERGRTRATLSENGSVVLQWAVNGTVIEGPDEWAGLDLRALSRWNSSLTAVQAEQAMLLRRALHLSNGRNSRALAIQRASDYGSARMGACFTYQLPRAQGAIRSPDWVRDFSGTGVEPLQDFDPLATDQEGRGLP